jgi:hypothetical protein
LLGAVLRRSDADLGSAVDRLVQAGILSRQGVPPQASYLFRHALVQDAAYGMLLREPRRALHARIAETIEGRFADLAETEPEILAHHFSRAALAGPACRYFERAGDRSVARSAYAEAVAHFNAALAQAERLPPGTERSERELSVLLKQGPAVHIFKGMQSPDAELAYRRAYDLAKELNEEKRLFKALWGLWFCANVGRATAAARDRVDELVALGQKSGDDMLLLEAIHCRWSTAFFRGDVAAVLADSADGIRHYDIEHHSGLGAEFGGHDPGVCAHIVGALALALSGRPRAAAAGVESAFALAKRLNQPISIAFAFMNAIQTYQVIGDRHAVAPLASDLIELAEAFNLPPQLSIATFTAAWASASGPGLDDGLRAMEAEFARVCRMGPVPQFYAGLLAGVGFYVPELHRLHGECLLRLDPDNVAVAVRSFETAIETATLQQAHIFRLAAAISLARAWAGAGRPEQGIAPLRQIVEILGDEDDVGQLAIAREMLSAQSP